MKKAAVTLIAVATFLPLLMGSGAWAQTMGGPGMHQGTMGTTTAPTTAGPIMMGGMGSGTMGMGGGMMGGMGGMRQGMMGSPYGKFQHLQYLQQTLGLSNEQVNTIYSIFAEGRKDFIKKSAEIRVGQIELWELLRAPKVDMVAVKDKLKKIEGVRTELRFVRIEKHEKVKSVLTPEQLEKLRETYPSHIWGDPADEEDSE